MLWPEKGMLSWNEIIQFIETHLSLTHCLWSIDTSIISFSLFEGKMCFILGASKDGGEQLFCHSVVSSSCDPKDCSLPVSSVQGISQARILEWVAISFSRGSSQPRDQTCISCITGRFFTTEPPGKPCSIISPTCISSFFWHPFSIKYLKLYFCATFSKR